MYFFFGAKKKQKQTWKSYEVQMCCVFDIYGQPTHLHATQIESPISVYVGEMRATVKLLFLEWYMKHWIRLNAKRQTLFAIFQMVLRITSITVLWSVSLWWKCSQMDWSNLEIVFGSFSAHTWINHIAFETSAFGSQFYAVKLVGYFDLYFHPFTVWSLLSLVHISCASIRQ